MSNDDQDVAEAIDEEARGSEAITSDEVAVDDAPDTLMGVPFADADVTDESFAERSAHEEPEVSERDIHLGDDEPLVIVDSDLLDEIDEDGDLAEPDD